MPGMPPGYGLNFELKTPEDTLRYQRLLEAACLRVSRIMSTAHDDVDGETGSFQKPIVIRGVSRVLARYYLDREQDPDSSEPARVYMRVDAVPEVQDELLKILPQADDELH